VQRPDLEPLRALLSERRVRERRRMMRVLASPRTKSLLADWKRLVAALPDWPDEGSSRCSASGRRVAARRIATVDRPMLKQGGAIDQESPPVALHELRKNGKELRYLLEFFARLFPASTPRAGRVARGSAATCRRTVTAAEQGRFAHARPRSRRRPKRQCLDRREHQDRDAPAHGRQ
jgi:CHAD domain-containing protein